MPNPDPIPLNDEQFELYLKQFRPLEPQPLPGATPGRFNRSPIVFAAWIAAAAVIFIAALLSVRPRPQPGRSPIVSGAVGRVNQITNRQPLTIGSAHTLLVQAPSFKAALDQMGFQTRATQFPKKTQSAFAALSKENSKL